MFPQNKSRILIHVNYNENTIKQFSFYKKFWLCFEQYCSKVGIFRFQYNGRVRCKDSDGEFAPLGQIKHPGYAAGFALGVQEGVGGVRADVVQALAAVQLPAVVDVDSDVMGGFGGLNQNLYEEERKMYRLLGMGDKNGTK